MGKYRCIFTADLHISNRLPHSKQIGDGLTDRLADALNLVERIIAVAKKNDADSIFILGDMFDRSLVDAVTLTHTTGSLVKTTVPIFILAGNHDANSIRGGRFVVEAFGAMKHKLVKYLDKQFSPREWLNFYPFPFSVVEETRQKIKETKKTLDKNYVNVLLFHNSVLGCDHLEWTCDDGLDPKLLTTGFDYAFGGHFHEHQVFGKKDNGMYCGAPMHHNFGDVGRKSGFWMVDFDADGTIEKTFIKSKTPKFHVINSTEKLPVYITKGDYVRLEVESTHSDLIKIKSNVDAFCAGLCGTGINAHWKHKPIYHHTKRLAKNKEQSTITMDAAIKEYLKAPGVVTGNLDVKKLKTIGLGILQEVRSENGIT